MNPFPLDHCLKLRLLGGFDVRLNDLSIGGFYNKMRALLTYLALEREQDHSRDMLAELLWGEHDRQAARDNLRRTLANLRSALETPSGLTLFTASKNAIRFSPNAYIDVLDFNGRRLAAEDNLDDLQSPDERVIALYQGELLAGLSLPDSPGFDYWLQVQRETLHRHALALLERLSDRYTQTGDYQKALQFALRHKDLEPWNENTHRRIMRCYALNNQASAAIQQYEICCRFLQNELGLTPDEATRQLAERIHSGEFWSEAPPTLTTPPLPAIGQTPAERRQVTVLYCELQPTSVEDADEAMALLQTPQSHCLAIIRRHAGHIEQIHGGGLLAYFGYPKAHENAARHAVEAALAVTGEQFPDIDIRASVHTGLIITGGGSSVPDTVGRTSRISIQLVQSAGANAVVISEETRCLVDGYFAYLSLGMQSLPGFARPLELFNVTGASHARTRLEAAAQLTPLAGRKSELNRLIELWEEAVQGACRIVLVQGDAGLGKSRLLHTMKARLTGQTHVLRELRCFPELGQSPFQPLIAMLEDILDFAANDSPKVKFAKLAGYLKTHYQTSAEDALPLLAQLLALPTQHRPMSGYSPQKQKEQTLSILLTLLQALATQAPVLLIVEDLHWADPSTLELLTLFVRQKSPVAILALFTARPEFTPPWMGELFTSLPLMPLVDDDVADMLLSLNSKLPADAIHRIVERADGVPLFIEEMAKMVAIDGGAEIPATLHDLLATRIDHIGNAKATAQLAATLGREFAVDLLGKISPDEPAVLTHFLSALQDAGLVFQMDDNTCQFKHALIQEAAYQSQTKVARQAAHQHIARILTRDFPDVVGTRPELIAQHLTSAGENRQAIVYWNKAGQRAIMNSANLEAIGHCQAGLQGLTTLPPDPELKKLEILFNLNLGTALIATTGYGSSEACQAYQQALELSGSVGDNAGLYNALWGMWLTSSSRVGHAHSLELAEKLLHQAEQNNDLLQLQQAHYAMGNSLFWTGQPEQGRIHLEKSMSLYQPAHHELMVSQFGENICVSSGALLLLVLWLLGRPKQADEVSQRTVALARQIDHPFSLGFALSNAAMLNRWMKQVEKTKLLAQEAIALSHEYGLSFWLGMANCSYGWALAMQGRNEGIALIRQSLDAIDAIMSGAKILFLAPLLEAQIQLRQFHAALTLVNEALDVVRAKDDRFFESEFHRLKGLCFEALSPPTPEASEDCFRQALVISRRQGAKALELRAATSLAGLCLQQRRQEQAWHVLEEAYSGFGEGLEGADRQVAAQLLNGW